MSNPSRKTYKAVAPGCPTCQIDFTNMPDREPSPGDVILCENCGKLYILSGSMALVAMTDEMELVFKLKYPKHWSAIADIRDKIARRAKNN